MNNFYFRWVKYLWNYIKSLTSNTTLLHYYYKALLLHCYCKALLLHCYYIIITIFFSNSSLLLTPINLIIKWASLQLINISLYYFTSILLTEQEILRIENFQLSERNVLARNRTQEPWLNVLPTQLSWMTLGDTIYSVNLLLCEYHTT